mgnify:CR=1 FL=1
MSIEWLVASVLRAILFFLKLPLIWLSNRIIMKYLFSMLFAVAAFATYACSCANPGKMDDKQYESYDLIASGIIDGVEENGDVKVIFFRSTHFYKGGKNASGILLNTPLSSAACGISPNVGEEWLIYARNEGGELHVSLCSRTIVLKAEGMSGVPDRAKEDLVYLENKDKQQKEYIIGDIETIQSEVLNESRVLNIYLPEDSVVADNFAADASTKTQSSDAISDGWLGLDIGKKAIASFSEVIKNSKTILWNGPMGVFEMDAFANGTKAVATAVAAATKAGAFSLVGGGDSVSAVKSMNLADEVSFVSTGGGAMLEFLEGKTLPGVAAIED